MGTLADRLVQRPAPGPLSSRLTAAQAPQEAAEGPWTKYQNTPPAAPLPEGPWTKYQMNVDDVLDKVSGAPSGVREAVGAAQTPNDRLATLRRFYPDAEPHGVDNFIFFDPEVGRPVLYNPPGFDVGDISSVGRELAVGSGSGIGAGAGFVLASPTAAVTGPIGPTGGAILGSGLGGGWAGALYDMLSGPLLGTVDTRGTGEKVLQAGLDVVGNAAGEGLGQAATSALRSGVSMLRNRSFGGGLADTLRGYDAAGVTPNSVGALTGNRTMQSIEQGLANFPSSSGVIADAAERRLADIEQTVTALGGRARSPATTGRRVDPADYLTGGEAVKAGGQRFMSEFDGRAETLYKDLGARLPSGQPMPLPNTAAALTAPADMFSNAPALGQALTNPKFGELANALNEAGGRLSWDQVQYWRSWVGRRLSDPVAHADIPRAELEAVYAGLSRDMETFANASGPEAAAAFRRANDFYKTGMDRINGALSDILSPNATGESVFRQVRQLALRGRASEDITKLWTIRSSMPPEAWDTYVSAIIDSMGRARPGAATPGEDFSVSTFLTGWNALSDPARNAMFNGTRYGGLRDALDNLTRVLGAERGLDRLANTSGTARSILSAVFLSGIGGGALATGDQNTIMGTAGAILAPRVTAKLITNPRFVRWLADVPVQPGRGARGMVDEFAGWMGRLVAIAKAEPAISEEIYQLVQASRQATQPTQQGQQPPQ